MKQAILSIPCLKGALKTVFFRSWLFGKHCNFNIFLNYMLNVWSQSHDLVILQEITCPSVPVSSERVSQHRHSDEERAGPMWAAAEATYILSGTPHDSKKSHNWAWDTGYQENVGEVAEKQNVFEFCYFSKMFGATDTFRDVEHSVNWLFC